MLTCSQYKYKCSQCIYTTNRKYNYDRHINMVHNISLSTNENNLPKVVNNLPEVVSDSPKVVGDLPEVDNNLLKVDTDITHENSYHCEGCYKVFSNKYTLKRKSFTLVLFFSRFCIKFVKYLL